MEDLSLYRRAKAIAELGSKISAKPVKISDIYAELKAIHQECQSYDQTAGLPSSNRVQD